MDKKKFLVLFLLCSTSFSYTHAQSSWLREMLNGILYNPQKTIQGFIESKSFGKPESKVVTTPSPESTSPFTFQYGSGLSQILNDVKEATEPVYQEAMNQVPIVVAPPSQPIPQDNNTNASAGSQGSSIQNPVEAYFGTNNPSRIQIMQFQQDQAKAFADRNNEKLTIDGILGSQTKQALNDYYKYQGQPANTDLLTKEQDSANPLGGNTNIGVVNGTLPTGSMDCGNYYSGNPRLFCKGKATKFAHGSYSDGCVADGKDQQFNATSASGVKLSTKGLKAYAAVALPQPVRKSAKFGSAVEVKDLKTGNCKVFPYLETGPHPTIVNGRGVVIDLTGTAFDILQGNKKVCDKVSTTQGQFPGSLDIIYVVNTKAPLMKPGEIGECTMLK